MFGRSISLFELFGFKVQMDFTWIFLAVLITWTLAAGYFPQVYPEWSTDTYWSMGIAGMLGLFFSLIWHEMSHSLVARRYGIPMKGITLFIFGGVAQMDEEPKEARSELLMAIAGPISSVVLAGLFFLLGSQGGSIGLPAPVLAVLQYLALINLVLAAFNMLPAFPLDGGRVLRAVLWQWKGDIHWATRVATRFGSGAGLGLIVLGLLSVVTGNLIGGIWWFLIGMFLRGAANASYQQLLTRRTFEGVPISRFMTADPVVVSPELAIDDFIENYVLRYHHPVFPVADDGIVYGTINARAISDLDVDERRAQRVRDLMTEIDDQRTAIPDDDADEVLKALSQSGTGRMLVIDRGGALVGIVTMRDLMDYLTLKIDLERSD